MVDVDTTVFTLYVIVKLREPMKYETKQFPRDIVAVELFTLAKPVEVGKAEDQLNDMVLLGKLVQFIWLGIVMVTKVKGFDIFLDRILRLVPVSFSVNEFCFSKFTSAIDYVRTLAESKFLELSNVSFIPPVGAS